VQHSISRPKGILTTLNLFVKRSTYRFVLQDKAVGGFKEAIAISKPTGLLANDIKRKIKPSNSQIPLKITITKSTSQSPMRVRASTILGRSSMSMRLGMTIF
jgi:hypothetical protein